MTTPVEDLAKDNFLIEARVSLFGRPCGMILCGYWNDDGSAEATLGLVALEPLGFARVQAALRFTPGEPLEAAPITEDDDACGDPAVIERHFGASMREILGAIFSRLDDAFGEAADLREDVPLPGEMPVREAPAYAVH